MNNYLALQNEKLQIKIKYLEDFVDNLSNFERTNQLIDLKMFIQKNYKRFAMLLDEIFSLKEQVEEQQKIKQPDVQTYLIEIAQLKATILQYQQQPTDNQDQMFNSLNKGQVEEQIVNLENTIRLLSNEIEELSKNNIKMREMLIKKDFFKEYEFMVKETEGLRQQNNKLIEQNKLQQPQKSNNNVNNFH